MMVEEHQIRLPLSLDLWLLAALVSLVVAVPLRMLAASQQDTSVDSMVSTWSATSDLASITLSISILCILLLMIFFSSGAPSRSHLYGPTRGRAPGVMVWPFPRHRLPLRRVATRG